jgi:hypothetical protein
MFFRTVNPATGELVQTFEAISGDDLEVALATAHKAYKTDWRLRPVAVSRAAVQIPGRGQCGGVAANWASPTQGSSAPSRQVSCFGIPQPVKQGRHLTKQIEQINKCN